MRQFDTLQSYLDNDGNPLVGRARFCDNDGVLKQVMDRDGNVIDSIVYTDASGRMSRQVFLEDSDYLVFFDRYDGNADPHTDEDEHSWNNQFSVKSLYDTFNISVDTEGEQCVSTMADLRSTNPDTIKTDSHGNRFVKLLGYFAAGDKESVSYVYDPEDSSSDDDGGSVIQPDGIDRGRWKMVYGEGVLDVRHFGAFPKVVAEIDMAQGACIQNAITFAHENGLKIFFPSVGNGVFYDISNRTFGNVVCSANARLFCKGGEGNLSTITNVDSVYLYADSELNGTINVVSEVLRTSYNVGNYPSVKLNPTSRIILDTNYTALYVWSDVDVFVSVDQTKPEAFVRCRIAGDGKFIGNVNRKFYNCEIRESMFGEGYDYELTEFHDCSTSVYMWESMDNFVAFCKKNKSSSIDLEGHVVSDMDIDWSCNISNGTINRLYIGDGREYNDISVKMENVSFALKKHSYVKDLVVNNVNNTGSTYNLYAVNFQSTNSYFGEDVIADLVSAFSSTFKNINAKQGNFNSLIVDNGMSFTDVDGFVQSVNVSNCVFRGSSHIQIIPSSSSLTSVTIKDSCFLNNALMGTIRYLYSGVDVEVIESSTFYVRGNANAITNYEKSEADIDIFNQVRTEDLFVRGYSQIRKVDILSIKTDGKMVNPTSQEKESMPDGSVVFEYDVGYDNEGRPVIATDYISMLVKLDGRWYDVKPKSK